MRPNFFGFLIFVDQHSFWKKTSFDPNIFGPKICEPDSFYFFYHQIFLDQQIFCTKNLFGSKMFWPIFFWTQFFCTINVYGLTFWTKTTTRTTNPTTTLVGFYMMEINLVNATHFQNYLICGWGGCVWGVGGSNISAVTGPIWIKL